MEAEGVDERRRVEEIADQLRVLGDALDNDPELSRIIQNLAHESYIGRQYTLFTTLIRQFVLLVAQNSNVPASVVEKMIRIFLFMWTNQEFSGRLLHELFPETSVDITETPMEVTETPVDIYSRSESTNERSEDIPHEVTLMDDEFIRQYHKVLKTGKQTVKNIRLMVVGMYSVGKTSLVENLIEKAESIQKRSVESTVGIDVTHCDIIDDKWIENIFDNDAREKFLEVMSASGLQETPVDSVDAGERTVSDDREGKPSSSKDADTEIILYSREKQGENQNQGISNSTQDHERDIEEFKRKLLDKMSNDDDPLIKEFIRDIYNSANEPHQPLHPTVSIWDFAGQYIYYSTHHFFLNSRSVYLLLIDVSKPLDSLVQENSDFPLSGFLHKEFTCLEAFKFWLNSIHMYNTQQGEQDVKPSVILVGTHKDCLEGSEEEKEIQKEDYFNAALKSFIGSPVLKHVHPKKFLINNLEKDEVFEKIREEVLKLAMNQKYWGELQPAKWISLERTFLGLQSEGKEIITFDEVKEANEKNEIPIESVEELHFFLQFQHSLGNILYYETKLLQNCVILSPQWIIDAFRCFVTHVKDKKPIQLKLWENYEKNAILTQELIDEIIDNNEKNICFRDYKKEVMEFMEHLDMIARPVDKERNLNLLHFSDGDLETDFIGPPTPELKSDILAQLVMKHDVSFEGHEVRQNIDQQRDFSHQGKERSAYLAPVNFYIVPSLLRSRPKKTEISRLVNLPNCEKTPILCMKFRDGFMPPSVFHRLLAVCIRKWKIVEEKGQCLLFNGFAAFYIAETSTLSMWFHDNIIYARISFYSEVEKSLAHEICKFLTQSLTEILRILPKESRINEVLPFDEYIQCSCVEGFKPDVGLIRMRDFLYNNAVMCKNSIHSVKKQEGIGLWCYSSILKQQTTAIPQQVLDRQPTIRELGRVTRAVGKEYYQLGLELDLPPVTLQQIRDADRFHLPTRIYHILYTRWLYGYSFNYKKITVEQLRNAMIAVESDIESFDCVFTDDFGQHCELRKVEGVDVSRKPTDAELCSFADGVGDECWLLGVELGVPEIKMQQLRAEHVDMATRVFHMLLEWNKGDTSIEKLGKALLMIQANMETFYEVFTTAQA